MIRPGHLNALSLAAFLWLGTGAPDIRAFWPQSAQSATKNQESQLSCQNASSQIRAKACVQADTQLSSGNMVKTVWEVSNWSVSIYSNLAGKSWPRYGATKIFGIQFPVSFCCTCLHPGSQLLRYQQLHIFLPIPCRSCNYAT